MPSLSCIDSSGVDLERSRMTQDELRLFCRVHEHPVGWIRASPRVISRFYHLVYSYPKSAVNEFEMKADIVSGNIENGRALAARPDLADLPITYVHDPLYIKYIGMVGFDEQIEAVLTVIIRKYDRVIT